MPMLNCAQAVLCPKAMKVHFLTAMRSDADRMEIQHSVVASEVTLAVLKVGE